MENGSWNANVVIPTLNCGHEVRTMLEEHKSTAKVLEMCNYKGTCTVSWTDRLANVKV